MDYEQVRRWRKVICVCLLLAPAAQLVLFRFFLTSVSGLVVSDRLSVLPAGRGA